MNKKAKKPAAARNIKGAVEYAHELYMFVEHAVAEAIHCGQDIKAQLSIPYYVVMQLPKGTYPGADLVATIHIKWDGALHGVDADAKSGKIS